MINDYQQFCLCTGSFSELHLWLRARWGVSGAIASSGRIYLSIGGWLFESTG